MATLPSFVELMASLGLDNASDNSSSAESSPPLSPGPSPASYPARSRSIPSLRDHIGGGSLLRISRYSPYASIQTSPRRGSLPSSLHTEVDLNKPIRSYSTSPRPSPSLRLSRKRFHNNLSVNVYDSTTDLSANMPISSYVRRKTPQSSPISPSFSGDGSFDSPAMSPMPFTLPTLPPLFCHMSTSSYSFPPTPSTDTHTMCSDNISPSHHPKPLPEFSEERFIRRSYRHGVRISTPPRSADLSENYRRRHIGEIA
jgi:hypothetical protein